MKPDFELLSVKILGEIEQMHFKRPGLAIDRRAHAEIGDSSQVPAGGNLDPDGPDAVGRELGVAGCQIGRRKSDGAAEFSAFDDRAANGVRPAKHLRRSIEISISDGLADAGAAHPFAVVHHRWHRFQLKSPLCRFFCQKRHIAAPVVAESPVLSNRNRSNGSGHQLIDKFRRLHFRNLQIEMQRDEKLHTVFVGCFDLVFQGFQQRCRSLLRGNDTDRMGVKCKNTNKSSFKGSGFHRAFDDGLVANVDTVENPQRKMQRQAESGQVFKAVSNQHTAGIAVASGHFKPYAKMARPFCRAAP